MEQCDNKSVGVIIENDNQGVLLLNRARFPFGLAAPAGHVDDHGSLEQTAVDEVFEEVGLHIPPSSLELVIDSRRVNNQCRRPGGDYHDWTVFRAHNIGGQIVASQDETKGADWWTRGELQDLADHTRATVSQEHKVGAQVFELIWMDFLIELGFMK